MKATAKDRESLLRLDLHATARGGWLPQTPAIREIGWARLQRLVSLGLAETRETGGEGLDYRRAKPCSK